MAQKTGKEETEFKALSMCVNNCGFTGNPATNNMCQKCFNNNNAVAVAGIIKRSFRPRTVSPSSLTRDLKRPDPSPAPAEEEEESNKAVKREIKRCSGCRRKVGLTGFRCRCGELFCGEHRYSDRHECSFDYKAAGREAIARENPIVKAPKILKL